MTTTLPADPGQHQNALTASEVLLSLKAWAAAGWIRRLDSAFAAFLHDLDAEADAVILVAAALTAHMEGHGHVCLPLDELLSNPNGLLTWEAEADAARADLMSRLPLETPQWLAVLAASPLVALDAQNAALPPSDSGRPLILRGSKLYLRRYWDYERRVARQIEARGLASRPLDIGLVRQQLDLIFPPTAGTVVTAVSAVSTDESETPSAPTNLATAVDWQKVACAIAIRGRMSIITGGPGTGKTYTAARLLALLYKIDPSPSSLRVALAAPTGKAAARLKESIGSALGELQQQLGDDAILAQLAIHLPPARTLHSLLGARPDTRKFAFDATRPLDIDVLMVDEASMVHLEMMAALLEALPTHARVILLGDKDQLASVEAGAVLGDMCRDAEQGGYNEATTALVLALTGQTIPETLKGTGTALAQNTVMLRQSRRFDGPIGQLALAVNTGDATTATRLLQDPSSGALHWLQASHAQAVLGLALDGRNNAKGGYGTYLAVLRERPVTRDPQAHAQWAAAVLTAFEQFRLLCAVREGEWGAIGLNRAVENALVADGRLTKHGAWYEGRPVMVTRNDSEAGVFNGDIGIALRPATAGAPLRVYFPGVDGVRSVAVSRLTSIDTAFAMTVHKSQGSEFAHTVLVLPKEPSRVLSRELVYTGITRARQAFTLVTGRSPAFAEALAQRTRRASGLFE